MQKYKKDATYSGHTEFCEINIVWKGLDKSILTDKEMHIDKCMDDKYILAKIFILANSLYTHTFLWKSYSDCYC